MNYKPERDPIAELHPELAAVVVAYRKSATYGERMLLSALEVHPRLDDLDRRLAALEGKAPAAATPPREVVATAVDKVFAEHELLLSRLAADDGPPRVGDRVVGKRGSVYFNLEGDVHSVVGDHINVRWDDGSAMGAMMAELRVLRRAATTEASDATVARYTVDEMAVVTAALDDARRQLAEAIDRARDREAELVDMKRAAFDLAYICNNSAAPNTEQGKTVLARIVKAQLVAADATEARTAAESARQAAEAEVARLRAELAIRGGLPAFQCDKCGVEQLSIDTQVFRGKPHHACERSPVGEWREVWRPASPPQNTKPPPPPAPARLRCDGCGATRDRTPRYVDRPHFTEYRDGNDVRCDKNGHWRAVPATAEPAATLVLPEGARRFDGIAKLHHGEWVLLTDEGRVPSAKTWIAHLEGHRVTIAVVDLGKEQS